jgi:hypothetical protein
VREEAALVAGKAQVLVTGSITEGGLPRAAHDRASASLSRPSTAAKRMRW